MKKNIFRGRARRHPKPRQFFHFPRRPSLSLHSRSLNSTGEKKATISLFLPHRAPTAAIHREELVRPSTAPGHPRWSGDGPANAKSPQLSLLDFPSLSSPTDSGGREGRAATAGHACPQFRRVTDLIRTPSQGSVVAKSPSLSPSPLMPAPTVSPRPSPLCSCRRWHLRPESSVAGKLGGSPPQQP
jgi:hypothetical protein